MNILAHLRSLMLDAPYPGFDPLRRAGYYDGEPRPKHRRHWANR